MLAVADEEVPTWRSRARDLRVDLLLAAGDLPWDYLTSLAQALGVPAVHVPGNHDPQTTRRRPAPHGFLSGDGRVVDAAGLRIAGLGGSVRYNDGPHQFTQAQLARRARRLVAAADGRSVDVLLTHAPPLGLGDEPDPPHAGFAALHDVLEALQPTWHLHGHIHPHGWHKADRHVGVTIIRNVIPWDVLEIEPRDAAVRVGAREA